MKGKHMRMYMSMFRIRFINSLQYRAAAIGEVAGRLLWSIMEILAFTALYRHAQFPMELSQTVSYLWIQQTLFVLFSVVFGDNEIYSSIQSGSIAYELTRPVNLYWCWFSQSAANRVSFTVINCIPALLIALLIPAPYGLPLPPDPWHFILFLFSAVLGLLLVVAFAMLMYISLFYIISQRGVKIIVTALTSFLSGGIIPLPFFPEPVLKVVKLLPFASMQNTPLLIYNGSLGGPEAFRAVGLQLIWLFLFFLGGWAFMGRSLRRVVVQGG